MKSINLILVIVLISVSTSFAQKGKKGKKQKKAAPIELKNQVDSVSYALGIDVANNFAQNKLEFINIDAFARAIKDAMKDSTVQMDATVSREVLTAYFNKIKEEEAKDAGKEGVEFLEQNGKRTSVKTTASGLQYEVITEGSGVKPTAADKVKVHYVGTLINGTKFDSSIDRGQPITFPLSGVIPGWTEGLQLMTVGSKYKFFIPYNLAYGERGQGQTIPPYATLIFEVELLDVNPAE